MKPPKRARRAAGQKPADSSAQPATITSTPGETFLSETQLFDRWGGSISAVTLRSWRSKGRGPRFTHAGRRVLYPLSGIVEYESVGKATAK
jgi:hypothetical protein